MNKINCVIFDWAGTTIDYGCFAPVNAFLKIFEKHGIELTLEEIRKPMGMLKKDHVRAILQEQRVSILFEKLLGRKWTESDVSNIYKDFEPILMASISSHTDLIDGVIDVCDYLRKQGIKIGSTTGYTKSMMEVVTKEVKKKGYSPDFLVTPDDVCKGRPYPYMIFKNMEQLGVYPPSSVIKVGDTISDIKEGVNAGCISVGVVEGSSHLGLSEAEYNNLSTEQKLQVSEKVVLDYKEAGAHYTIQKMIDLTQLIESLNQMN